MDLVWLVQGQVDGEHNASLGLRCHCAGDTAFEEEGPDCFLVWVLARLGLLVVS